METKQDVVNHWLRVAKSAKLTAELADEKGWHDLASRMCDSADKAERRAWAESVREA